MFVIQITQPNHKPVYYRISGGWASEHPANATWFGEHERGLAETLAGQISTGRGGFAALFPGATAELLTLLPTLVPVVPVQ